MHTALIFCEQRSYHAGRHDVIAYRIGPFWPGPASSAGISRATFKPAVVLAPPLKKRGTGVACGVAGGACGAHPPASGMLAQQLRFTRLELLRDIGEIDLGLDDGGEQFVLLFLDMVADILG